MADMIASGVYDVALGSRILGGDALKGGMPVYKYVFNPGPDRDSESLAGQ
ncbi:hypothetical protein DNFV4_00924 [Nitrospira tepida]|uniref:Uncharacterized protein n=1 Tax=Nitrospira tepida TaxID=2973512 RepID=A0AA86MWY8_9BACT|nr:hypothetical protein DNFV4_00924 [Nitrospira tepida]